MSIKVIFLDIDGVLNTTRSCIANRGDGATGINVREFDPVGAGMIRSLCIKYDTRIVISSTWRQSGLNKTGADISTLLYREMNESGLLPLLHKDWKTPSLQNRWRGEEINAWLKEHPEILKYAIIDDDNDFQPEQREFFVRTKAEDGLLTQHYRKLGQILA